jgi:SAM-dependent methyltransferase
MRRLGIYTQMLFRYRPREFWNAVLGESFSLRGVGHYRLSEAANRRLYDAKRRVLDGVLTRLEVVPTPSTTVLEVGSGVGFWTEYMRAHGVTRYTGNDIAPVAIERLRQRYPEYSWIAGDASEVALPAGAFDLAIMIDVTQHITDDAAFERAMRGIWRALRPGGAFAVTYWDPRANRLLATKLRLNRIEKPRPLASYTALWGAECTVLVDAVPFNDKHLAVVRKESTASG